MAFSADGKFLATTSGDKTADLWEVSSSSWKLYLKGHAASINAISFSRDGVIATASADKDVRLWDMAIALQQAEDGFYGREQKWVAYDVVPTSLVAISPDWNMVATTTSGTSTAQLWYGKTGLNMKLLDGHQQSLHTIVFSPDGALVATADEPGSRVCLWDTATGKRLLVFSNVRQSPCLCFSPSGKMLAVTSRPSGLHGRIVRYAREATRLRPKGPRIIELYDSKAVDLSFSSDEKVIAAAGTDGLRMWDIRTGDALPKHPAPASRVRAVAFSPNQDAMATGSAAGEVFLWDYESGREVRFFGGHATAVTALCFSPDGAMLASTSKDTSVRVWDVGRGACLHLFRPNISLKHLSFSSCGGYLQTDRGRLRILPDRQPQLFASGGWITEGNEDILYIYPETQPLVGFVINQNVVFLQASLISGEDFSKLSLTLGSPKKLN